MPAPLLSLTFGLGGDADGYLRNGWSFPEAGHIWTIGEHASLRLPASILAADSEQPLILELNVTPMLVPGALAEQILAVAINGITAGTATLRNGAAVAFAVPVAAFAPGLDIDLFLPNATVPAALGASPDTRRLGMAVSALRLWPDIGRSIGPAIRPCLPPPGQSLNTAITGLTGLSPSHMIAHFESLGQNCDFGLAQQKADVERLSLLRFAGIRHFGLLRGLHDNFVRLDDPSEWQIDTYASDPDAEFFLRIDRYGAHFHTSMTPRHANHDLVRTQMGHFLPFLRRKFLETLAAADSLYVLQEEDIIEDATALPVLTALRRHADNALLYVVTGDNFPPGTVERRRDGLYRGWRASGFDPSLPQNVDLPLWLSLCANAYRLWRESGRGHN